MRPDNDEIKKSSASKSAQPSPSRGSKDSNPMDTLSPSVTDTKPLQSKEVPQGEESVVSKNQPSMQCKCDPCTCDPCLCARPKQCTCDPCTCDPCLCVPSKQCKCDPCTCDPCLCVPSKQCKCDPCTCDPCLCVPSKQCKCDPCTCDPCLCVPSKQCTCDPCTCDPCLCVNSDSMIDKCRAEAANARMWNAILFTVAVASVATFAVVQTVRSRR
jgi:hypothetical protein